MDDLSDSAKAEVDSVISTDSLRLVVDEFNIRHLSTPDVSNIELSKRVALLELENERLRTDLENVRIELNARIAANQGLKDKITELYVEMQTSLQEKQRLQNALSDKNNCLSAAETSAKWYQSQVHGLQANKKTLQLEIDTYQRILKKRQQAIIEINMKYKTLNAEYTNLLHKYQQEKQDLEEEIRTVRSQSKSNSVSDISEISISSSIDTSAKLEAAEDELRDKKAELKALEQRLLGNEISKMSMENALTKQRVLISSMKDNIQKCEIEKNETADILRKTQFEVQKLKSENEALHTDLLSSKQEQRQTQDAIFQLKVQLSKMITQYKLLKTKNTEAEEQLKCMQDLVNENKRLKTLSHEANSSLLRRLREEKRKVKGLETELRTKKMQEDLPEVKCKTDVSLQECLKQVLIRNKDLQDQLKALTKTSDESIDEGYADSCTTNFTFGDIPSPAPINSVLFNTATTILAQSKQFYEPIQIEVDNLYRKLSNFKVQCVA